MSSLDEVSALSAKVEDLKRKESEVNEKNKILQKKFEVLLIEVENEKSKNAHSLRKSESKPSSRREYYHFEEVKYESSDDDALIKGLIQSNANVMSGADDLAAVYLEILQDLK